MQKTTASVGTCLKRLLLSIVIAYAGAFACVLIALPHAWAEPAYAPLEKDNSATAAQLVLTVEFSNSPEQNGYDAKSNSAFYRTQWEYLQMEVDDMNTNVVAPSFRYFIHRISEGKVNVKSYFPQTYEDGTHLRIRVNMTAQQYIQTRDDEKLIQCAFDAIAQRGDLDPSLFDLNADGYIDNVLLIPELKGLVSESAFASHQGSATTTITLGTGSHARKLGKYIAVRGGRTDVDGFYQSVAAHEYLHTLGARDLYRNANAAFGSPSGDPVGYWDIMCKGGAFSWPLAITRELVGWTKLLRLAPGKLEASYTLSAPGSGKTQAICIPSSVSSSEFFVVEYRKKNPTISRELGDASIGSSGLIVYRVNNQYAYNGNIFGQDYIYVFRPGETGLTTSAGDVNSAAICAESYKQAHYPNNANLRSSVGSTDLSKGIADGAICYSDGTNSGIGITALSQTDDSITFKIAISEDNKEIAWDTLSDANGLSPFSNLSTPETACTTDGSNLYVAAASRDMTAGSWRTTVRMYDGNGWSNCGATLEGMLDVTLVHHDGALYAAGTYGSRPSSRTETRLYKLENGSWSLKGAIPVRIGEPLRSDDFAYAPSLGIANGKLYLAENTTDKQQVYRLDASGLTAMGDALPLISEYMSYVHIADIGGSLAVIASTSNSHNSYHGSETSVYRFSGNTWQKDVSLYAGSASAISSATFKGKSYVFVQKSTGAASMYTFSGSGDIENEQAVTQNATLGGFLFAGVNNLYICTAADADGVLVHAVPDGNLADSFQIGGTAYRGCSGMAAVAIGDKVYVVAPDNGSSTIAVRSHGLASGDFSAPLDPPVMGDGGGTTDEDEEEGPTGGSEGDGPTGGSEDEGSTGGSEDEGSTGGSEGGGITDETVEHEHAVVELPAVAPTCTETGLTAGSKCSICGDVLVSQEEVLAKGHVSSLLEPVAPTCVKPGLTEGSRCSVCGEVLVAQQPVAKLVPKPKATKLKKLSGAKKKVTVKWAKQAAKTCGYNVTGYQLRYSTKASMKKAKKSKLVKGYKKTSLKIGKLKAKTKYYVQVRTYVKVGGKTYYSKWSPKKSVKTK